MDPVNGPARVKVLLDKYEEMRRSEVRYEGLNLEDASTVIVAYGTSSRSSISAMNSARQEGIKVGLFRPITLFPFPEIPLAEVAGKTESFLVAEMSAGQLIEDVKLAVGREKNVSLVNRYGGVPLTSDDILEAIRKLAK